MDKPKHLLIAAILQIVRRRNISSCEIKKYQAEIIRLQVVKHALFAMIGLRIQSLHTAIKKITLIAKIAIESIIQLMHQEVRKQPGFIEKQKELSGQSPNRVLGLYPEEPSSN